MVITISSVCGNISKRASENKTYYEKNEWYLAIVILLCFLSAYHMAICLYSVLKIAKTTNTSTKNHKIFAFPCVAIEKPIYLHIFCNRNRKYYEYGNKNAANIRD